MLKNSVFAVFVAFSCSIASAGPIHNTLSGYADGGAGGGPPERSGGSRASSKHDADSQALRGPTKAELDASLKRATEEKAQRDFVDAQERLRKPSPAEVLIDGMAKTIDVSIIKDPAPGIQIKAPTENIFKKDITVHGYLIRKLGVIRPIKKS